MSTRQIAQRKPGENGRVYLGERRLIKGLVDSIERMSER